jgi:hypothetical protein
MAQPSKNHNKGPPDHLIRGMKSQFPWSDEENEVLLNCSLECSAFGNDGGQSNARSNPYGSQKQDMAMSWDDVLIKLPGRTREDVEFHLIELTHSIQLNFKTPYPIPDGNRCFGPTFSRPQNQASVYDLSQPPSGPLRSGDHIKNWAKETDNNYSPFLSKDVHEMPSASSLPGLLEPVQIASTKKRRKLNANFTAAQDEMLVRLWFGLKDPKQIAQELGDKNEKMVKQRKLELAGDDADLKKKPRSDLWQKVLEESMVGSEKLDWNMDLE